MISGDLFIAHMPKWKRSSSTESAFKPTLRRVRSTRNNFQHYSHQHIHVGKGANSRMSEVWNDLVCDAPNAPPRVVDVVANSPSVSDLSSPSADIRTDAPLADIVLDVAIHCIKLSGHVLEARR
jgi:hypothetical protein